MIPSDRCNVMSLIQSDGVRQKYVVHCEWRGFWVAVGPLPEELRGEYFRGVHRTTSVCRCQVNPWNVEGEMFLDHARARGGGGALDPVVRHTKRKCLRGKVDGERLSG